MTTTAPIAPQQIADLIAQWINSAKDDPRLCERLGAAQTSMHVHLSDTAGATLWLEGTNVKAEPRIVGNAEVEMWGTPEQFVAMIRREQHMAMLIADGELEYAGPVRKFLRIVPILRSLDFSMWRDALRPAA